MRPLSKPFLPLAGFALIFAAVAAPTHLNAGVVVLDNFTNGVSFTQYNTDPNPMPNNSWTCVSAIFNTVASVGTYDGSPALKITDPDGGSNGLYCIFPAVVPHAGKYVVRCKVRFFEIGTKSPYSSYMLGCTLNGPHRQGSLPISTTTNFTRTPNGFFDSTDNSGKSAVLQTPEFQAAQGASLRVELSTSEKYTSFSSNWFQSYVLVDDVELVPTDETPVALSAWEVE